jgi:hypothetical protein
MLVMFAVGVAHLLVMAVLTALMVYEKVGRHGATAARVAGVGLLGAAALQLAHPAWLPATFGGPKGFVSDLTIGPGPAAKVGKANGYELELRVDPNRAFRPGSVWLKLSRSGRAVNGASVRATFTMLDMEMGRISAPIPQSGKGTYAGSGPVLGMAGRWGVQVDVAPRRGEPFAVRLVDHVRE